MKQALGDITVVFRPFENFTSAVTHQCAACNLKLITFGMTTEVVVIVYDQDSSVRMLLAIKVRGRKTTYTASDDDKIIQISIGFSHRAPIAPAFARELMGDLE